jgi:hypothetical protein
MVFSSIRPVGDAAAETLHFDLELGEVLDQVHLAIGDDDLRLAPQNRLHQVADALLRVLVVTVGVDHDVGAELQRALHAVVEGAAQSAVTGMPDEVGHAVGLGHLDGAIGGTVVDDQHDDLRDPGDLLGDGGEHHAQGVLFVETGDLHHQFDTGARPWRARSVGPVGNQGCLRAGGRGG